MTTTPRPCPVCALPLVKIRIHDQHVDRCRSCKGTWFDAGELESLVGLLAHYQRVELDEEEIDTIPVAERLRHLHCPVDGTRLDEHEVGHGEIIDICPVCSGIWLDGGELAALRLLDAHVQENIGLYMRLGN